MWFGTTAFVTVPAVQSRGTSIGMGDEAFDLPWAEWLGRGQAPQEQARRIFVIWTSVLATGGAALIYALLGS
jgi:hypothetical protein